MQSQIQQLFRVALGLAEPWVVSKIESSQEQHQLDLYLDFPAGSKFACPVCGRSGCGVYDTEPRTWRHLNFFQHKTGLHARQPRVLCPDDGVKTVEVPWARPGVGFTLLMEAFILVLVQGGMTPTQAARLIDEHDTRLGRGLQHSVDKARSEADFSGVTALGVDETSRSKGHNYISVFMDLDRDDRRVLFATEGKDAETVKRFREDLEAPGGKAEQVQEACLDLLGGVHPRADRRVPRRQVDVRQLPSDAVAHRSGGRDPPRGTADAPGTQRNPLRLAEERMEPHGGTEPDV
jgi:transposase